jgi:uncharacterized protein YjbI with pentapeptide repeats
LSFANVYFIRPEHCECWFYESWALQLWIDESWSLQKWILWELRFLNVDNESWELRMWILWEQSIVNVNFTRAEQCKCDFYKSASWAFWMWKFMSWALCMWISWELSIPNVNLWELIFANMNLWEPSFVNVNLWELSFANVIFLRAELCESKIYESSNSILDVYLWAKLCACEFYESWAEFCECQFYESWALWIEWDLNWDLWYSFYESWALQKLILGELSIVNVNL